MSDLWEQVIHPQGFVSRFVMLMIGLAFFALALVMALQSNLGAGSWTVFHDGIDKHTPLTLGMVNIIVGFGILGTAWALGVRPGIGTVLNMILIGIWVDVYLGFDLVPEAHAYPTRVLMLLSSVVVLGFATALYIKPGFGAGPRDSFMLALTRLTDIRIGVIRWTIEVVVVILGIFLGGEFGIGTILSAILIGPMVDFFFNLFRIQTRRSPTQHAEASPGD